MKAQQFNTIVQQAADGILVVDADGVVLFANPASELLLGRTATELTGTRLGQPIVVDGSTDMAILRKNGELVTVEMRATEITWNEAPAVLASLRDVTERVRVNAQVEHLNSVLRAIRNVNQLIVREKEPTALLERACELLVDGRGYRGAWIATGDGQSPSLFFAQAGWGEGFAPFADSLRQGKWPMCLKQSLASDKVLAVHNLSVSCHGCPLSNTCEHHTALVTPLNHGESTLGLMGVSLASPPFDDIEERALLTEVSKDIAFALHDIENERQRVRAVGETKARLRANRAVLDAASFEDAARNILGICREQVGATAGYIALRQGENEDIELFADVGGTERTVDPSLMKRIRELHAEAYQYNRTVFENEFQSSNPEPASFRNVMFVPIALAGEVEGVLGLANKTGDFTKDDARRSHALGEIAALALERDLYVQQIVLRDHELQESEAQHRLAQHVAHLGHWELKSYDGTPNWSEELFRIFGLEHAAGEPSFSSQKTIVHPEDWPLLERAMQLGFENGTPFYLVFRILRPGQQTGWIHAIGNATRSPSGKVIRMFGTAQDITALKRGELARKQSEEELRRSQQLLEVILDSIPTRVFWKDKNLVYLGCNAAFARDAGFTSPQDIIGRDDTQMGWRAQADLYRSADRQVIETGQTQQLMEEPQTTPTGSTVTLLTSKMPLRDSTGEITGILGTYLDITELKQLQAQLAQADRLSSLGMLAAGVAHEVNNPLSYILYNLESLADELPELLHAVRQTLAQLSELSSPTDLSEKLGTVLQLMSPMTQDDILARCKDALDGTYRIRDVMRGLGTFSRVESDQLVPVNLMHVVDVAVSMATNEIKYRARLVKDYGLKVPLVMASEGRLSQVFLNLLINATHAIDEGDLENNEIRVKTWAEGEYIYAQVRDTGSGITPENLGKLFEPFFTTKKIGVGSGLGLAISKGIVEGYGGTIEVESTVGIGTCFTIRLPVGVLEPAAVVSVEADVAPVVRGRILIVDDEAGIRVAMARMLPEHDTVQAANGAKAQELLERDQGFDLILCDLMMSEVSGMDLHAWLAEKHPRLAKQLIFITGGAFTPRARDYLSKVDNIRLEKPFDRANLKKIVGDHIRLAKGTSLA